MANQIVAGELYETITGQLFEIGRQLRQNCGYPHNAEILKDYLQDAIEGRFRLPDYFRETGELTIEIPARKRPTLAELQAEWSGIAKIVRDTSPEGPVTLRLGTVLRPEETKSINGPEYARRILSLQDAGRILGWQHRKWLVQNQDRHPILKALLGKIYMDFSGIVVLDDVDDRRVPYANGGGGRWFDDWRWIGSDFHPRGRIAVSASSNSPVSLS